LFQRLTCKLGGLYEFKFKSIIFVDGMDKEFPETGIVRFVVRLFDRLRCGNASSNDDSNGKFHSHAYKPTVLGCPTKQRLFYRDRI
jgi:hypothetical protein